MNRSKLYITLLVALVFASAASVLVFQKLNQNGQAPSAMVVVATKDLDIGAALTPGDLKVVAWTGGQLPKGAISKTADLSGRGVIYPISENEVILDSKLAAIGAGAGLPATIPQGMRAVSIRVDDVVAVAGFVGPGTRVDVLLTGSPMGRSDVVTKTILQNVQVLAAGQKTQPDSQGRPEKVNVVTLLCSGEDSQKVTLAANEGHLQLVLRNPTDSEKMGRSAAVGRNSLYGEQPEPAKKIVYVAAKAAPAPPPPPPAPVAVVEKPVELPSVVLIRADRVSTVQLQANQKEAVNQ
jgi:pilus assembly protein CpaB